MNDSRYQELREIRWRRKLTGAEAAELRGLLAAQPELKADWEVESGLSRALQRLPEAPVASNFTARVLQALERETAASSRRRESGWSWLWHPFLPRAATAGLAFCLGLFLTVGAQPRALREKAQGVADVAKVVSLPGPEILRDFEAIRQLNTAPPPDNELLALLQ